jgi:hypothetical protein
MFISQYILMVWGGALRTQSEVNDPNYGKCVPPNRKCVDRAKYIGDAIGGDVKDGMTALDIGSNVGYFTFLFQDMKFNTMGVDFDSEKIEFSLLLRDYSKRVGPEFFCADVNLEYLETLDNFDLVSALSILHLYFIQHGVSKHYWINLVSKMMAHAKRWFLYETNKACFGKLGVSGFEEMAQFMTNLGGFRSCKKIGTSVDARRPLFLLER